MDLEATDASPLQNPEQLDEEFTRTAYPNVQENLKLPSEDPMIPEEPASSTETLSSLQNLEKEPSFTDQFFVEKQQEEEPGKTNAEVEVSKAVDEIVTDAVDWRDYSDQLLSDLEEARQKKRKRRDVPRTPFGSPPPQPPPPPPPADASGALGTSGGSGSSQLPPPPPPLSTSISGSAQYICLMMKTSGMITYQQLTQEKAGGNHYLKGSSPVLLISKIKAASYPDFGLELLVSEQMWIEDVCTYDISAKYGISHWWFNRQKFYIDRHDSPSRQKEVSSHMQILSVVRVKAYSRYGDFEDLNLLLLQGHLDHLPGSDKRMLSTAVKLWTRNLVIR
nr:hypothetical protein [Tanacetum cinerariifolium]